MSSTTFFIPFFDGWSLACEVPERIRKGQPPSSDSADLKLMCHATQEKWDMALRLLHSMRHSPRPNSRTYNAAIAACERGSQWEQAFQVYPG